MFVYSFKPFFWPNCFMYYAIHIQVKTIFSIPLPEFRMNLISNAYCIRISIQQMCILNFRFRAPCSYVLNKFMRKVRVCKTEREGEFIAKKWEDKRPKERKKVEMTWTCEMLTLRLCMVCRIESEAFSPQKIIQCSHSEEGKPKEYEIFWIFWPRPLCWSWGLVHWTSIAQRTNILSHSILPPFEYCRWRRLIATVHLWFNSNFPKTYKKYYAHTYMWSKNLRYIMVFPLIVLTYFVILVNGQR